MRAINATLSLLLAAGAPAWSASRIPAGIDPAPVLSRAIRAGDLAQMKQALDAGADPNAKDAEGTPMLMNAALYGSAAHMKLLVERGADVNARNAIDATALLWSAGDAGKVRLLVNRGADVNATSKLGRTPLMAAASVAGNVESVRLLLSKGANVNTVDQVNPIPVLPVGGGKGTALMDAARTGDVEMVRAMLAAGADVQARDARNATALSEAVAMGHRNVVRTLMEAGAKPEGKVTALQLPYAALAVLSGNVELARMIIAKGGGLNDTDAGGMTPLMWASMAEGTDAAMVEMLIAAGARTDARSKAGESASDWAARRGDTAILRALRKAGAPEPAARPATVLGERMGDVPVADAVRAAIAALAKPMEANGGRNACATCHNQALPAMAWSAAIRAGITSDEMSAAVLAKPIPAFLAPATEPMLEASDTVPDLPVTGGYFLEALYARGYEPNRMTAAVVQRVAQSQMADGRWVGWAPRKPLEGGDIQATAMAVRAITLYPVEGRQQELDRAVERARRWLMDARPATTEDHTMRLLGLFWSGAPNRAILEAARQLGGLQRDNGGWAQLPTLEPDAYATGKAMMALRKVAAVNEMTRRIPAGTRFLRSTQLADGSWHVATRAFPFQPLKDSGFPHGRDQWISAAATSWAAMALTGGYSAKK